MTDNPHAPPTSQSAKPVAWRYHYPGAEELAEVRLYEGMSCEEEAAGMVETPLYAHPPATASQSDEALVKVGPINRIPGTDSISCLGLPSGMMCFGWGEQGWAINDKDGKRITAGNWGECATLPASQSEALVVELERTIAMHWQSAKDAARAILPILHRELKTQRETIELEQEGLRATIEAAAEAKGLGLYGGQSEALVEELARAIYDAEDTASGDHVGTVIYGSEHAFYETAEGQTEADACREWAIGVCRDAARAILPIITAREAALQSEIERLQREKQDLFLDKIAARAKGKREGIEEAATVAEASPYNNGLNDAPAAIATAIRARLGKKP